MLEWVALLAVFLVLAGCAGKEAAEPKWEESLYRTVVYNSGEDESDAKYLEIAQRSQKLLALLEEKAGAFVMDAYNYQTMNDEGTPLYAMNSPEVPIEIAPAGMSIQVSREYFKWNPIETADGSELEKQIVLGVTTQYQWKSSLAYAIINYSISLEEIMRFREYDTVKIIRNCKNGAKEGEIGTILIAFKEPIEAYEIEIADEEGRTKAQYTLLPDDLELVETGETMIP